MHHKKRGPSPENRQNKMAQVQLTAHPPPGNPKHRKSPRLCVTEHPERGKDLAEREKWGRLAAYTAQTINSITKTYDEVRIEATPEELRKYVEKHIKK